MYKITVIQNTQTFLDKLLESLYNPAVLDTIGIQVEADLPGVIISSIELETVVSELHGNQKNETSDVVILVTVLCSLVISGCLAYLLYTRRTVRKAMEYKLNQLQMKDVLLTAGDSEKTFLKSGLSGSEI